MKILPFKISVQVTKIVQYFVHFKITEMNKMKLSQHWKLIQGKKQVTTYH